MPLHELDPSLWRSQVAWVPQQPHLFQGTIADNLRLARPEATLAELVAQRRRLGRMSLLPSCHWGMKRPLVNKVSA